MIKVSPKAKRLLVPIVSVIAGFLVGAMIMLVWSYDPFQAYSSMFESALGSANGIGETIRNATPLIFIAIGFQISSAAGFFNIGLPGQAQAGWLTAIWIGLAFKGLPVYILLPFEIIAGRLEPDSGTVTWGQTTSFNYMSRDLNANFDNDELTILDWLRQYADKEHDDNTFLRGFLGRMLFSGDEINKQIKVLSGGEEVRCQLSRMMLEAANVLVMDDPTNHLDLESITALNEAMENYPGSILFTSHDHEFIQNIAYQVIEVGPKGVVAGADIS